MDVHRHLTNSSSEFLNLNAFVGSGDLFWKLVINGFYRGLQLERIFQDSALLPRMIWILMEVPNGSFGSAASSPLLAKQARPPQFRARLRMTMLATQHTAPFFARFFSFFLLLAHLSH